MVHRRKNRLKRLVKHFSTPTDPTQKKIQRTTLTIELLWSFFEFYLILLISGAIAQNVKTGFLQNRGPWIENIGETLIYGFFQCAFLQYMLSQQGKKFNCNFGEYLKLLGVRDFQWSIIGTYMVIYHVAVFAGLFFLQRSEGEYFFTLDNYYPGGSFSLRRAISLWVLTPVREEIYFRACVFTTALHRSQFLSIPILLTGVFFGGAHLLNLFRPSVSTLYILLQVISGLVVGVFYCLRFLVTGSLWESIILHMVNNIGSSFLPAGAAFDFTNPKIGLPMTCTLIMYSAMSYVSLEQLKKHKIWGQCFKEKLDEVEHPFKRLQEAKGVVLDDRSRSPSLENEEEEQEVNEKAD